MGKDKHVCWSIKTDKSRHNTAAVRLVADVVVSSLRISISSGEVDSRTRRHREFFRDNILRVSFFKHISLTSI